MKLEKYKEKNFKNIGITVFIVICILLVTGIFLYTSFASFETKEEFNIINGKVEDPGDLYFTFYVNDVISKNMPQKGEGYILDTEKTTCTNGASVEFNEIDWSIKVLNMTTTRTKCTLYFKEQAFNDAFLECNKNSNAANCLINNSSKNKTELAFDETVDNNLRYIGTNPNNYVSFNNELWRIIGAMNNIDDGTGKKETRLKIIKSNRLDIYNWDYDEHMLFDNNWLNSQINRLLNGAYYNQTADIYYSDNSSLPSAADFSSSGLNNNARSMISNAVWHLGGISNTNIVASDFYNAERGEEILDGSSAQWVGNVGLIYASDYAFATSGSDILSRENCLKNTLDSWDMLNTDIYTCATNDWLYFGVQSNYWTISPSLESSTLVVAIYDVGMVTIDEAFEIYEILPSVYLNANIKVVGGDGSSSNPYQLSF